MAVAATKRTTFAEIIVVVDAVVVVVGVAFRCTSPARHRNVTLTAVAVE